MDQSLCPCGQPVPKKTLLGVLNKQAGKRGTVVCTACQRLLFVEPLVSDAEKQMTLFELAPLDEETISVGRAYVHDGVERGITCPCCEQTCALKAHKLSMTLVSTLCQFLCPAVLGRADKVDDKGWLDSRLLGQKSRNLKTLKYWGLVEEQQGESGPTGKWRATPEGAAFVEGNVKVAKVVYTFNNRLHSKGVEEVHFDDFAEQEAVRQ